MVALLVTRTGHDKGNCLYTLSSSLPRKAGFPARWTGRPVLPPLATRGLAMQHTLLCLSKIRALPVAP